ncbi:MAG: beta-N-acetylhexosaminidase [Prolixibacteraceae bacterium]|jgi:hexosaminidase
MSNLKTVFTLLILTAFISVSKAEINIIPHPANVVTGKGNFILNDKTPVISNRKTQSEAEFLGSILVKGFGVKPEIKSAGNGIRLVLNPDLKEKLDDEGYHFKSQPDGIVIEAVSTAGIFYGIQTLRQLMPAGFEFKADQTQKVTVQEVEIWDKPRFPWRAFMLDESRNFKGVEVVKSILDQMALLKMNTFHWHLTDDQGWRIEIKKYPKLTEIGGYRKDTQKARRSDERLGVPQQGFYTQEQIKEIIRYAEERHITIVPEIEMPGHAMAAIASYPWLGTLGTTTEVPVTFGKMDDSYNVANPRVYQFLEDVLTEVFKLFPGKVIHIGGDEVNLTTWKNSPSIMAMMKKEGLNSPADLQIYFTNQISNFIDKHGRRMMGWNEILGDNIHDLPNVADTKVTEQLAKSAIIQFWKGNLDLIQKAVSEGYDVVNSYHAETYLDYNYKTIPLSKAYTFDPIPEGLPEKYDSKILGTGCQMWGEWIPTVEKMDMQVYPRLAAYAEVGWTSKSVKNYTNFLTALPNLKKRWKLLGISYTQ